MPRAWLVAGPPGSGKSTLGRVLARRLGAPLLDLDVLTNPLVAVVSTLLGVGEDLDEPRLRALVREPRYEVLLAAGVEQVRNGCDVVLVAPFTAESTDPVRWHRLSTRLRDAGADDVRLVWLDARPALLERRLRSRLAPRDLARVADEHRLRASLADIRRPVVPAILLDADQPADRQADSVLSPTDGSD